MVGYSERISRARVTFCWMCDEDIILILVTSWVFSSSVPIFGASVELVEGLLVVLPTFAESNGIGSPTSLITAERFFPASSLLPPARRWRGVEVSAWCWARLAALVAFLSSLCRFWFS